MVTTETSKPKWTAARHVSIQRMNTIGARLGLGPGSEAGPAAALAPVHDEGQDAEYWQQADEMMQTGVAWKLRRRLRTNPLLTDELARCTFCVLPEGSTDYVSYNNYCSLQVALYKALVDPFNPKDARKCAKQDWASDCKGTATMTRELLMDSIFELTDTWTRTVRRCPAHPTRRPRRR